jgi:hypothetical protein
MTTGNGEGPGAERREAPPASGLSLSICNNSIRDAPKDGLPGPWKKQAQALKMNIIHLSKLVGVECLGFLTATCGDLDKKSRFRQVFDRVEFQARWNSLLSNVIRPRYRMGVTVIERCLNGAVHPHLVHWAGGDIRTGIDFEACFPGKGHDGKPVRKPDYRTAPELLRSEWTFWRETAPKYGFGRCQLQPLRKDGLAVGCYLAKYLSKHWANRLEEDCGCRNVRYFGEEWRTWFAPFGWCHVGGYTWREMLRQLAGALLERGWLVNIGSAVQILGKHWAWTAARLFAFCEFDADVPERADVRLALREHNRDVEMRRRAVGGVFKWHVGKLRVDHFRPLEKWLSAEEAWSIKQDKARRLSFADVDGADCQITEADREYRRAWMRADRVRCSVWPSYEVRCHLF